ncbi:MAG: SGNH/GDSL hydrolase family protein [Paracoccaceae bacterium]
MSARSVAAHALAGLACLAAVTTPAAASPVLAGTYDSFLVFGDSLSDPGNLFAATAGAVPASPPYAQGRFSNGPVWAEIIAEDFGPGRRYNTAFGGALATTNADTIPDLGLQLGGFLAGTPPLPTIAPITPGDRPLAAIWAGSNDIFGALASDPAQAVAAAEAAAGAVADGLDDLQAAGGVADFLVFNVPDLGLTPRVEGTPGQPIASAASDAFDATLRALAPAPGREVTIVDVLGLSRALEADPGAFGVSNTDEPCVVPLGGASGFGPFDILCDSEADFAARAFFDRIHPNAVIQTAIAGAAVDALVPIPATLLLLGGAVVVLGLARRRQR